MNTELEPLKQRSASLTERVQSLKIIDQPSYNDGADLVKGIKNLRKEIKLHHQPVIDAASQALRIARDAFGSLDNPLASLESALKQKLQSFQEEQERQRRIEQRRLEELARQEREEAALVAAIELEQNGGKDEAESLLEEIAAAPAPFVTAPLLYQRAAGISKPVDHWSAEVIDLRALVAAWLAGDQRVPKDAILANDVSLNRLARAMTSAMDVPGVRANNKPSLAIRA